MFLLLFYEARAIIDRTYYNTLGLDITASELQIKEAYRQLSKKMHPDRAKLSDRQQAQQLFQRVNVAYQTLADPEKRNSYDKLGVHLNDQNRKQIFQNTIQKMQTTNLELKVSLADLFKNQRITYSVKRSGACSHCHGTGAFSSQHLKKCPHCSGKGIVEEKQHYPNGYYNMVYNKCPKCQGSGSIPEKTCPVCSGRKLMANQNRNYTIQLNRGMTSGTQILIKNLGDQPVVGIPGDCLVVLRETQDKNFVRSGTKNLRTTLQISLKEALLGFQRQIEHMDGRKLMVQRELVTQPGQIIRLKGQGMGERGEQGELQVQVKVGMPALNQERRDKLLKGTGFLN